MTLRGTHWGWILTSGQDEGRRDEIQINVSNAAGTGVGLFRKRTSFTFQVLAVTLYVLHEQVLTWQFVVIWKVIDDSGKARLIRAWKWVKSLLTDCPACDIRSQHWRYSDRWSCSPNRSATHPLDWQESNYVSRNCSATPTCPCRCRSRSSRVHSSPMVRFWYEAKTIPLELPILQVVAYLPAVHIGQIRGHSFLVTVSHDGWFLIAKNQ